MDQASSDRIIELAWKWQNRVTWDIGFEASADWRKFRDKATQNRITAKRMRDAGQLGEMLELFQHDAERGDEIAETCHKQAVASQQNLLDLANLLREHAPKLLRLVPVVNFHDAAPADLLPWLSAMREIEGEILALVEPTATPTNTVETPSEGSADIAGLLDRLAVLFGDGGGKMLRVVNDPDLTTDQKLREMERIDQPRIVGMNSNHLGEILGVTGQAIRATFWWIERQNRPQE